MAVYLKEQFELYDAQMLKMGYSRTDKNQIQKILTQLEAISPYEGKPTTCMEVGYTFFANGLRVYIWTSYEPNAGTTRVGWDSGKVVITEFNKVEYYGAEVRRIGDFFGKLHLCAEIQKERILHRPVCTHPGCGRLLKIFHNQDTNQYYWYCEAKKLLTNHPSVTAHWDCGLENLSDPAKKYNEEKRKGRARYNKLRTDQGKSRWGTSRKNKKIWKKKNS